MITLEQAAIRVANHGQDEQEVFLDPITLSIIISIISTIFSALRLWCQWRQGQKADGDQIKEMCASPPFHIRRRVRRVVREKLSAEQYQNYGDQMVASIFAAGAHASPAEIEQAASSSYVNRFGEAEQEL